MRGWVLAAAASVALSGCGAIESVRDYRLVRAAKALVAGQMKDPGAAQFRDVYVRRAYTRDTVCGQVNGKNNYGAYVGFVHFIAKPAAGSVDIEPLPGEADTSGALDGSLDAALRSAWMATWRFSCEGSNGRAPT